MPAVCADASLQPLGTCRRLVEGPGESEVFVRANAMVVLVAGALLVSGCDATPRDPDPAPSTASTTATGPGSPTPSSPSSPSPSTPEPTVSASPTPTPTPTPTEHPIGSGTIILDGLEHVAAGDCVVSTPAPAAGPLPPEATVTFAMTTAMDVPGPPISVRASTDDGITVRVDAGVAADGAQSWAATQVVAGLVDAAEDGRAVLTLTAEVAPAQPPPTLPVGTPSPAPTPDATPTVSEASPTPTPSATPPRRTRPDPVPGTAPTGAASRLLDVAVECRVTTDSL